MNVPLFALSAACGSLLAEYVSSNIFFDSYFIRMAMNVMEAFVCILLFMLGHERRPHFLLRLAAAALVTYASCIPLGKLYSLSVGTNWFLVTKISVYLLSYAVAVAVFFFCYRDCFSELFLCGLSGVAAQSLVSNFASVAFIGWPLPQSGPQIALFAVHYGRRLPVYAAVYFLFCFRCPHLQDNRAGRMLVWLAAATLIVTIGLGGVVPVYSTESFALSIVGYLFSMICALFVLVLRRGLISQMALRRDLAVEELLRAQEQKQYEQQRVSMEQINVKCHDLKHQMARLQGRLDAETLSGLAAAVSAFDSVFHTGNDTLDVILNEKNADCLRRGIRFTCMGDGSAFSFIKPADLYSLFGNALDNAIEATDRLDDAGKKAINLHLDSSCGAEIDLMNYFDGKLTLRGGLPVTSKADTAYHGFGVRSMQLTVHAYGGELHFSAEEDVFRLQIRFPAQQKKENGHT